MRALPILIALSAAAAACASKPPPPPEPYSASLTTSADVNPDAEGRPSPILVKIFLLKSEDKFSNADFFALFENPEATLGEDLLGVGMASVAPGAGANIDIASKTDAAFVGVVAGFQNIDSASWRDVAAIDALKKNHAVVVTLGADTATIEKKSE